MCFFFLIPGSALAVCSISAYVGVQKTCAPGQSARDACSAAIQQLKTECQAQSEPIPSIPTDPDNATENTVAVTNGSALVLGKLGDYESQLRSNGTLPEVDGQNPADKSSKSTAVDVTKNKLDDGSGKPVHDTAPDPTPQTQKAKVAESQLPQQAPPQQVNEVAKQYLDSGSPDDAQRLIGRVLKNDPANPDALSMRAQVKLAAGDSQGALDDARAALKSDPNNPFARMLIGHSDELSAAGSRIPKKLATGWNTAADDSMGDARGQRGAAMGSSAAARSAGYSERAGGLPASNLDSALVAGWSQFRIGDMKGAADAASAALDKNPGDAQALGLRAAAYNRLGKPLLALADAEAALKAKPKDVVALLEKGYAQYQLGLYRAALSSVESALQVDPLNAMGHLYRGMILEKLNRVQDALASYLKAAELDPSLKPLADEAAGRLGGAANMTGPMSSRHSPAKIAIWVIALLIALGLLIKGALRTIKPDWATPVTPLQ